MSTSESPQRRTAVRLAAVTSQADGGPGAGIEACSLEIAEGELVAVVGPAGAGKTRLLRLVAGLALPAAGAVYLEERPVTRPQQVGFAPQSAALVPWRTVLDNVLLVVDFAGV